MTRATEDTFDVVYRVLPLGRKTPSMAASAAAAGFAAASARRSPRASARAASASCCSTGVGVGPMLGYAEAALAEAAGPSSSCTGFRDRADVCCGEELDALLGPRFAWTPCITMPWACTAMLAPLAAEPEQGRVSRVAPPKIGATDATHFIVGNGAMVKEVKQGLLDGGVAEEAVTTEVYFNGAEPDAAVVEFVAEQLRAGRSAPLSYLVSEHGHRYQRGRASSSAAPTPPPVRHAQISWRWARTPRRRAAPRAGATTRRRPRRRARLVQRVRVGPGVPPVVPAGGNEWG